MPCSLVAQVSRPVPPAPVWVVEANPSARAAEQDHAVALQAEAVQEASLRFALRLRGLGFAVRHEHGLTLKKQLGLASQSGAPVVFIIGADEAAGGTVAVKDMATGNQGTHPLDADWAASLAHLL